MSYKIRFDDITSFQTSSQTTIASWGQSIASINTAMSDFINDSSLQGEGIAGIRTYLSEVHGTLLQTLIHLMNDYSSSFLLYKDGYYNIESDHHAELPEQVFTTLQSDLKNSHDRFNHQLELLNAEKDKISDLVSYSGTSHTSTALDYGVLTTKLKTLDSAIQQYESNHARQDLTAFKELVSATKALLSEYSGQTRKISSYRSGDLGKLQSVERFATAYQQVEQHITNTMDKVQAAQERDRVRFEALAAEERKTQGWIDLALGAVTIAVGVAAIVASGGAATPLVAGAWIAGGGTVAYGLSNTVEAGHNLYLGYQGDGKTHATNPIRDTLFMGNDKTYHQVGGLFTTASAILIPIGKTQSLAKGLTEFTIGEVGGFAGHQAAYHGTKLLGGSEADAQRASFVGSILGGYAASSAASKFTLNDISPSKAKVPEVNRPSYNREHILKNIEESKLARESSNFQTYLKNENSTKNFLKTLEDMSPDEARRYQQWYKFLEAGIEPEARLRILDEGVYSPKTFTEFSKANPTQNVDDYIELIREQNPWPKGYIPQKIILREGDRFNMVLDADSELDYIGGWGLKEEVPNIKFVNENMAVKFDWKPNLGKQVTYEVKHGKELNALYGPVGPQIDLSIDKYLPGDLNITQYDLFNGLGSVNRSEFIFPIKDSVRYLEP